MRCEGEEFLLDDLAQGVADQDMRFLDARGGGGGDAQAEVHQFLDRPAVMARQGDGGQAFRARGLQFRGACRCRPSRIKPR